MIPVTPVDLSKIEKWVQIGVIGVWFNALLLMLIHSEKLKYVWYTSFGFVLFLALNKLWNYLYGHDFNHVGWAMLITVGFGFLFAFVDVYRKSSKLRSPE